MGCVAQVYANSLLSLDIQSPKKVVILSPSKFMKESANISLPGWFNSNVVFVDQLSEVTPRDTSLLVIDEIDVFMFKYPAELSEFIKNSGVRLAGFTASAIFSGNAASFIKHHEIRIIGIGLSPDERPVFDEIHEKIEELNFTETITLASMTQPVVVYCTEKQAQEIMSSDKFTNVVEPSRLEDDLEASVALIK